MTVYLLAFICNGVCVWVCMSAHLGGLGMLPPTLDSQTVRVPDSYGLLQCVCRCVCGCECLCVFMQQS